MQKIAKEYYGLAVNLCRVQVIKMKLYVSCPLCGHRLCKAENGSNVDIKCQRCNKIISVQVVANQIRAVPAER